MKQSSQSRKPRSRNNSRKPSRTSGQASGNRTENRVRGNPKQLLDKYKTQAREARQSGDRIMAEHYHQFADHYQRVINEMRLGCGGVFEEYREVVRREAPVDQDDEDQIQDFSEDTDDQDTGDGDQKGADMDRRASRSERAARADEADQAARSGRGDQRSRQQRGRRRKVTVDSDLPVADVNDLPSIIASDEPSASATQTPEDTAARERPAKRRLRRKPAAEGDSLTLGIDEPSVSEAEPKPETDAA